MLSADTIAWSSILLSTVHSGFTDISVIHGKYALDAKQKLNIVLHQFVISSVLFGLLFQLRSNIHTHMMILVACASCWYWFDGCFMAKWQRDNVLYTPDDFPIIQKPKHQRLLEFLGTIIPLFLFDLYKLC
jgi:hypothetical protein